MTEENIERMAGSLSCLTMVMQVVISKHPEKQAVIAALKALSEDAPTLMALNHPGRPTIGNSFADALSVIIRSAEESK
jgi:hypothetical protein